MAKIHIHTKYSLLDAIIEPEQLVKKVKEQDGDNAALCVTEHGNLYSDVEVYKLCKQHGVKYLLGCEMYICEDVNIKSKDSKYNHLVVIAKNEIGRLNLNKLVSESCKYKYYGKPRIDFPMLYEHKDGLIVLSACMAGEVQRALRNGNYEQAKDIALKYKNVFNDDYYLEYQSHSEMTQQMLNKLIVKLAKELNIKFVVTTDAHYLESNDQKYHGIFVQIGQAREVGETYNDCYVQTDNEILNICQSTSREDNLLAIQNTNEITDKCNVDLPLSDPIMQHIDVPEGFNSEIDYLKHLCIEGWYAKKIDQKPNKDEYKKRLAYEIHAIEQMGFEWYFLFVHSYANSVKRRGIARGSAGGSLVCYLSNITDIDPIEYKLYFERFIDVGALELLKQNKITKKQLKIPDCDLDFGKQDRNKVLQHVINEYGQENVASLGLFQYIWAKGAIKDIGRVLGIPFEVTNEMTSRLDKESIKEVIELGLLDKYKEEYPELFDYAERLAGLPKSFSAHPCGKIAANNPIIYYNAIDINENGEVILQGDMHTADDLGLIKADFLGLRTVDVIYDTLEMIGKNYEYIAPHNLNFEDKKIFENFRNGYTAGVFQFESPGMKDTLKKIECSSIEDLIVSNALFRPGSIKYIDNYANRKKGIEQFEYLHNDLKPILQNTFGIIVFQEQLIEIGRMAGLSNPDELRKATAKKKASLLDKIKPELFNGLRNRSWSNEQLNALWEIMLDFASYSFNRCISGNTKIIMNHFTNYDEIDSTYDSPFYFLYLNVNCTMVSVEDLYYNKYSEYNSGITLSMFPDGNIKQNRIIDIKQSGIRKIYRVTTDNDKWIDCTINHKFPTPNGEKKLYELNIGDELYTFNYLLYSCYQYSNTNKNCVEIASIVDIEYIKEEMTYDITMDDPAHNFVANNGIITSNSHSAAYAIIAYICMFLKTYHPKEFLCAWTNSVSNKTEKVAECVEEINRLQIPIYLGKYNDCSSDCKVYKDGIIMGTKTIKYCNSELAYELMSLPKVNSFIEMLDNISKTSINTRQLNALIGLNFFSDFGNNKKLFRIVDLYNGIKVKPKGAKSPKTILPSLRTCNQIKKDKIPQYEKYGVTKYIVEKYSDKETLKQYSQIDNKGMLNELTACIPDNSLSAINQVKFDMEYLQYTTYQNSDFSDDYYIVTNYKTYKDETKPSFTLRNLNSGNEIKTRIKQSKIYKQNPFGQFSVLQVFKLTPYPKKKLINGKWQNSDEEELILENYDVLG